MVADAQCACARVSRAEKPNRDWRDRVREPKALVFAVVCVPIGVSLCCISQLFVAGTAFLFVGLSFAQWGLGFELPCMPDATFGDGTLHTNLHRNHLDSQQYNEILHS